MNKLKSSNGVTLTSLVVYVVVMVLVVTALSIITSFFFSNIATLGDNDKYLDEFTKINEYFVDETNENSNDVYKLGNSQGIEDGTNLEKYSMISFCNKKDNNITTYQIVDGKFYRNDYKVCDDVKNGYFTVDDTNPGYVKIAINIQLGANGELTKRIEYTLKV